MKQLVIGMGQIGSAVQSILGCDGVDKELSPEQHYDVIHVAIPYNDSFDSSMQEFIRRYTPDLIVVHSTVAPGTCDKYGAVHSPVRGRHPNLAPGVQKFRKYFGGLRAPEAAVLFAEKGVDIYTTPLAKTTEFAKLFDTEQYREAVLVEKGIYKICQEEGIDFETAYTDFNKSYNAGYEAVGEPQFKKYVLSHRPGQIGGHCLESNHAILKENGYTIRLDL
jgi:UDP-N-acetyl-D-mannosaminuronate dehydrogenase